MRRGHASTGPRMLLSAAGLVTLAACGGGEPLPEAQLARAQLAVQQAVAAEAGRYAPTELNRAQESLDQARGSVTKEEFEAARRQAEMAEVEAQLAQARSDAMQAREAAEAMGATVDELKGQGTPAAEAGPIRTTPLQ